MVWWHAETAEALQEAYTRLRRTALGRHLDPVWSQMALHRPAEFNRSHIPAFLADEEPRRYVCVYPFVRSYEWYLLPDEERRFMLAEHGKMARDYPDVRANTVASFALGDYEWMLAFEADELHRIVDLMRELRAADRAAARPRGGAVLHRRPQAHRRAGQRPRLTRRLEVPRSRVPSDPCCDQRAETAPACGATRRVSCRLGASRISDAVDAVAVAGRASAGASSKRCPRWLWQVPQRTSVRTMPWLRSSRRTTLSAAEAS